MMVDPLGSSRVSSQKQNREGMVKTQSKQYRATAESSPGCGGDPDRDALILMFDVSSIYLRHNFAQVWALASDKLTSLEIGYISSLMVTELLCPNFESHQSSNRIQPSILPNIHKLCLSVDYITDAMVGTISKGLLSLTHLDLRDAPPHRTKSFI
ncbi:hypothetical protein DVH24_034602 [Malus domestica]|uniref:Uncharacterized protein n=1 Tax=Malus domestica TaxID=3750 RepID=A0A498J161_MALDO|nr:hypothetical protein DVH24_034602 [Malus domestica]